MRRGWHSRLNYFLLALFAAGFLLFYKDTMALNLTSTAFAHNQAIPVLYTCNGENISPPLQWTQVPKGTQSFVLMVSDPDAPGGIWDHWIVFNLPADTRNLVENVKNLPAGAQVLANSWNRKKYDGPCPPSGTHRYIFTLYALKDFLTLPATAHKQQLMQALQPQVLAKTELTGLYQYAHK